jgi:hypothetical protein
MFVSALPTFCKSSYLFYCLHQPYPTICIRSFPVPPFVSSLSYIATVRVHNYKNAINGTEKMLKQRVGKGWCKRWELEAVDPKSRAYWVLSEAFLGSSDFMGYKHSGEGRDSSCRLVIVVKIYLKIIYRLNCIQYGTVSRPCEYSQLLTATSNQTTQQNSIERVLKAVKALCGVISRPILDLWFF